MRDLEDIIRSISKSYDLRILHSLKNSEMSQKELSFAIKADKSIVHRRLREFKQIGLVEERYDYNKKVLMYALTDYGYRVLKWLELFYEVTEPIAKKTEL